MSTKTPFPSFHDDSRNVHLVPGYTLTPSALLVTRLSLLLCSSTHAHTHHSSLRMDLTGLVTFVKLTDLSSSPSKDKPLLLTRAASDAIIKANSTSRFCSGLCSTGHRPQSIVTKSTLVPRETKVSLSGTIHHKPQSYHHCLQTH